jgi:hypothetical protein
MAAPSCSKEGRMTLEKLVANSLVVGSFLMIAAIVLVR